MPWCSQPVWPPRRKWVPRRAAPRCKQWERRLGSGGTVPYLFKKQLSSSVQRRWYLCIREIIKIKAWSDGASASKLPYCGTEALTWWGIESARCTETWPVLRRCRICRVHSNLIWPDGVLNLQVMQTTDMTWWGIESAGGTENWSDPMGYQICRGYRKLTLMGYRFCRVTKTWLDLNGYWICMGYRKLTWSEGVSNLHGVQKTDLIWWGIKSAWGTENWPDLLGYRIFMEYRKLTLMGYRICRGYRKLTWSDGVSAREEGSPARSTETGRCQTVGHLDPLCRQFVQVGGADRCVAIAAKVTVAKVIRHEQQDIGRSFVVGATPCHSHCYHHRCDNVKSIASHFVSSRQSVYYNIRSVETMCQLSTKPARTKRQCR